MVSAFQSQECGYGLELTTEQLDEVSKWHAGKMYAGEHAANSKKSSEHKGALTKNPFVIEFEYGASNEGYWNYEYMALQLKDCV